MNQDLINCYFCDSFHQQESIFITEYNDVMICYECIINHKTPIHIMNNKDCCVCYENNKSIELPNCKHDICIVCYKKIYYGFVSNNTSNTNNTNNTKNSIKTPEKREAFPNKNEIFDEYVYTNDYDFSKSLQYLLERHEQKKHFREEYMNSKEFIEYEISFITYCKKQYDLDMQDIEYYNHKTSNIANMLCPLCRM